MSNLNFPDDLLLDAIGTVCAATGRSAPQRVYEDIRDGLMTKPIKLGRSSRWPRHEHQAIAAARIAGHSEEQIRRLVDDLHALRVQLRPLGIEAA